MEESTPSQRAGVNGIERKSNDTTQTSTNAKVSVPSYPRGKPVVCLWPILGIITEDGIDPYINGLALFSEQTEAAEEEIRRLDRQSRRGSAGSSNRKSGGFSIQAFL